MKRYIICIALAVFVFTFSVFAINEGDYGYYDVTADGKVEIVDVLGVLQECLNGEGDLLRVIRVLKLTTESKVVTATITDIDVSAETVTMFLGTEDEKNYFSVPLNKIGFDEYYHLDFFLEGVVTMTVSGDFEVSKDVSLIHAAEASSRYDICEIRLTEGEPIAIVNGVEERITAPVMIDGELFVDAVFLGEKLEQSIDGDLVSARVAAESVGAKVTFDAKSNSLVIVKQFLPTFVLSEVSGKAGDTMSIVVSLLHNPGVSGIQVHLRYNADIFTYKSSKTQSIGMLCQASPKEGANPFKYVAANTNLKNVYGDLNLVTFNLEVSDNAEAGVYFLEFVNAKLYDSTLCNLRISLSPVSVNVTE